MPPITRKRAATTSPCNVVVVPQDYKAECDTMKKELVEKYGRLLAHLVNTHKKFPQTDDLRTKKFFETISTYLLLLNTPIDNYTEATKEKLLRIKQQLELNEQKMHKHLSVLLVHLNSEHERVLLQKEGEKIALEKGIPSLPRCAICTDTLFLQKCQTLSCGHCFHASCLEEYERGQSQNVVCATCKGVYVIEQKINMFFS
jgi:hypothetical protein